MKKPEKARQESEEKDEEETNAKIEEKASPQDSPDKDEKAESSGADKPQKSITDPCDAVSAGCGCIIN